MSAAARSTTYFYLSCIGKCPLHGVREHSRAPISPWRGSRRLVQDPGILLYEAGWLACLYKGGFVCNQTDCKDRRVSHPLKVKGLGQGVMAEIHTSPILWALFT